MKKYTRELTVGIVVCIFTLLFNSAFSASTMSFEKVTKNFVSKEAFSIFQDDFKEMKKDIKDLRNFLLGSGK